MQRHVLDMTCVLLLLLCVLESKDSASFAIKVQKRHRLDRPAAPCISQYRGFKTHLPLLYSSYGSGNAHAGLVG